MDKKYRSGFEAHAALPFMLPRKGPAGVGEAAALQLPLPRPDDRGRPRRQGDGDRPAGDGR